jgi:quercetin dioxygenase-like cupin family protein
MQVIHFTSGAADPLIAFGSSGARFLPLLEGQGSLAVSCLHLESKAEIPSPSLTHAVALLVVHGRITVTTEFSKIPIDLHAGMGAALNPNEPYSLISEPGAILVILESQELTTHARAISTPQRIARATWPSD